MTGPEHAHTTAMNLHATLGAAFFGFSAGAMSVFFIPPLLVERTQHVTLDYTESQSDKPTNCIHLAGLVSSRDARLSNAITSPFSLLDTLHFVFSMYLVYNLILQFIGYAESAPKVLWSVDIMPCHQIRLGAAAEATKANDRFIAPSISLAITYRKYGAIFVIFIAILAVGKIYSKYPTLPPGLSVKWTPSIQYVVYLGFGATAFIDCAIAGAMCLILHKSGTGVGGRSEGVLESIIQYFVGSGLTTRYSKTVRSYSTCAYNSHSNSSLAAILCICLARISFLSLTSSGVFNVLHIQFVAQPDTLLYLGMEFSVTRLYANSVLAMFNARRRNNERMNQTIELKFPSGVMFGEPGSMSQTESLISNPFSPGQETKYSECDQCDAECSSIKGHKEKRASISSRGYTV
ncbi:hypothetical protein CVT25_008436 [Psilocybe cyanescens]|uniref:DUF6534 domain-containing protein n=1 Tax=Psilocybe cyanescens TaxID=93625 RepID=A0A409WUZ4_PSICY|nr:hypothetical protein CVT25_008436 [Psilocybe cyanescens]